MKSPMSTRSDPRRRRRPTPRMHAPFALAASLFMAFAPPAFAEENGRIAGFDSGGAVSQSSGIAVDLETGAVGFGLSSEFDFVVDMWAGKASARLDAYLSTAGGKAAEIAWLQEGSGEQQRFMAPAFDNGPAPDMLLILGLREISIRVSDGPIMVEAGRIPVNFGVGRAFSPADIFFRPDYSGTTPQRQPVDALRVALYPTPVSSVDFIAAPFAAGRGKYALRGYAFLFDAFSVAATAGRAVAGNAAQAAWTTAGELKIDTNTASFYGEGTWTLADGERAADGVWSAMAGFDTGLGDAVLLAEYAYEGSLAAGIERHRIFASLSAPLGDWTNAAANARWSPDSGAVSTGISFSFRDVLTSDLSVGAGATRTATASGGTWSLSASLRAELAF